MTGTAFVQSRLEELVGVTVEEVLALEGFPDESGAVVYVSGSVFSGHGNPWSDIDVFALTDRKPVGSLAQAASTNGRRFDWEFWRPEGVRELAERVSRLELGTGRDILGTAFLHIEQCFIHRLRVGIPILDQDGFAGYRERFDFDRFRAFQAEEAIRWLDALVEDLCGMIEVSDADAALFTSRELVGTAVDAYCHHHGNTDPVRKWRVKHLEALAAESERHREVCGTFWRLQFPDAASLRTDWQACQSHLEECLRFAERLAASVQQ